MENKTPSFTFLHCPCQGDILHEEEGLHTVQSPVYPAPSDFSSLVLSVRYNPKEKDSLLTEVQVCQCGVWSKFFKLALYTASENRSYDSQEDDAARLCVDELVCKRPAQAYRFRLTVCGAAEVSAVVACLWAEKQQKISAAVLPAGSREINVRPVSQMCLPVAESERVRLCSPSSLSMALDALGIANEPLETASAVYDTQAEIYGNWTFNTAYACRRGVEAFVTRFESLAQLEDFLTPDSLVLASISYKEGELDGAAVKQTPGHLVFLCGWENGKIRVADPAAKVPAQVVRFYDAEQFAHAWLQNKRGAAYLVRKI